MRMAVTIHRTRTRTTVPGSETTQRIKLNWRTTPEMYLQCGAKGDEPYQKQPKGWKGKKQGRRVKFGRAVMSRRS